MVKGFQYYREGWPIRSMIIQHLANSKKRWNEDVKIENAERRRPNREAIAAYKDSLGGNSRKSKEHGQDTETEDNEDEDPEDADDEEKDFDVVDIDDEDDKRNEASDSEMGGDESHGGESDTEAPADEIDDDSDTVNKSLSFISIFFPFLPTQLLKLLAQNDRRSKRVVEARILLY